MAARSWNGTRRTRTARRSPPRLPEDRLEQYALRALARRWHSVGELREKLKRRALDTRTVEPLLGRLTERGWLDDRRFALGFARYRAERRRYGRHRIARELRQKGINDKLIEEALAAALPEEQKEREMVRKRVERRLCGRKPPYPQKLLRSAYASLLRAGFPSAIIRDELFARTKSAVPEDVEVNEDEGP